MSKETTKNEAEQEATQDEAADQEPQGAQEFKPLDEVTVGGQKVKLKAPDDPMICREIALAYTKSEDRGACAALGACWASKGRPRARYKTDYNPLRYGGDVYNELVKRGVHPRDIAFAGLMAVHHCADAAEGVITKEEVDAAVGFTDAEAGSK